MLVLSSYENMEYIDVFSDGKLSDFEFTGDVGLPSKKTKGIPSLFGPSKCQCSGYVLHPRRIKC